MEFSEEQIAYALAEQRSLRHISLGKADVDLGVVRMLYLAVADPPDIQTIVDAEMHTGYPVRAVVAGASQVGTRLTRSRGRFPR